MKKLLPFNICLFFIFIVMGAKAQVWFPEGEYNLPQPVAFTVDNQQIFTICKYYEDTTKSYWVVAKYEGRNWTSLPVLTLNKGAEVMNIKFFNGAVYVGGNFTFGGIYPSLVRFSNSNWGAVTKFARANGQLPVTITALEVFNKKLILGGNFNSVLASKDSLPYLIAYDGTAFSSVFNNCKNCFPNAPVIDLAVDDSLLAISGTFTVIRGRKSQYAFLYNINEHFDTFISTPAIIDRIALKGNTVIGSGISSGKERKIYKLTGGITDLKFNFDSVIRVNEIVWFDKGFWINGLAYLKGNNGIKSITLKLPVAGSSWEDFSSNYPGAKSIATGKTGLINLGKDELWAIGSALKPLSIWNTNKSVVRFFPNSALVKARVFLDSNNNCFQDKNERVLSKQLIRLTLPLNNRYAITNESGLAEFLFTPPSPDKLRFNISLPRNYRASNCAFDTIYKSFTKNYFDSIIFPVNRKININDVKVVISAPKGTQVMKDKRTEYVVSCANVGSNIVSGFVRLKKNKHLASSDINPISEYVATLSSDSVVVWSYANLKPGETRFYKYSGVAYDTSFKDNTLLQAQGSASIAAAGNDFPDDDSDSIEQIIDNSLNPFRKDIYPIPNPGDSVSYLTMTNREIRYNISINNFGSSMVYNSTITDTLDLNLDMSYIEELGSNKSYYTEIETDPNNSYRGILIWHFPNINLTANPGKNFENPTSGAYISFKVVMKPLSNGYIVKNTAAVFFDNNYAGKTNTAYCTILNTGIDDIKTSYNGLMVYPNPANNLLNIKLSLNTSDKINIFNQQGAMVKTDIVTDKCDNHSIDIESLSNGIYVIQVIKGGNIYFSKFVKMR